MFRTSMLALIFGFASITVSAEDARQLTCSGMMIEPSAMSQSPETVILTLGPAQKVALDRGQGVVNARKVSDNKIQLKFRTKARKLGLARAPLAQLPSSPAISFTSVTIL